MNAATTPKARLVDVGRLLDEGPFTSFQKSVIALAAMSVVVDGFDSQLIGFAIPAIAKEWNIARGSFAPAVAAGLLGMGIGSACAGLFADRFGRRWALIGSVFLFGMATCTVGMAPNILAVGILRFFAGLGIGGALPSSTTLAAEFTPLRRRTLAVTATIVCVPLGGMFAGLFARVILPAYGWRFLFVIGGALPVVLGLVLIFTLPESPRFLARHPGRWWELSQLLARMWRPAARDTRFSDQAEQKVEHRKGFAALFGPEHLRDSLALWCAFFMCLLTVYSAFSWLPAMLISAGLSGAVASSGLTAYNLGGVLGALGCAVAITRLGSRWPLLACCAGAAVSALLLRQLRVQNHATVVIFGLGVHGLFVNAVQSTMLALCAYVYPTAIRATGTASALAFGRLGAVLSGYLGAAAIAAGGSSAFFLLLGGAMLLVLLALASVRHHIPALPTGRPPQGAPPLFDSTAEPS
jgi:AAHS family 4-hydroxybenzoate transporter-like MFS transporter